MQTNTIHTISVQEFKKRWDQNPNLCLIDVREPDEWQEAHIPGAKLIPKDELPKVATSILKEQNQPIYLHCRGGIRSLYAAQKLLELGYLDVYSLDGGITEWANAGFPIEK